MATQPDKPHAPPTGEWEEFNSRVRQRWSELSEEDLQQAEGNIEALIAVVQRKTGEAREQVERFVTALADEILPRLSRVGEAAAGYSADAVDNLREQYDQAAGRLKERYQQAQDSVRHRPTQSVAIAFGAGLLAGFVLVSVMCVRNR